ncbi:protein phosphatase 1 regulatory subunit 1C isoform X2 [Pelobates fuscus]|uniref:protein phosphatase 1 regulatory subunit 1C isoform X2 n=1 Tax=Pelobates fuscus TaxID=191477 RepID=UPI002FE4AA1E
MEPNSPKKIQFSVPVFESQLDPEASEQIRKRRPTPASLVILNDHSSPPEIDEKRISTTHEERKQSVYSGPNMKGTVQFVHLVTERSQQQNIPRRKDTPCHNDIPFIPGVKQMKKQNKTSFPEEEEGQNDEECDH